MSASQRIARRFARLKQANRAGFVTFTMAGDPDPARCLDILRGLPAAGADLIELGMPFSDPMADGPAVQEAGKRALAQRVNLHIVLDLAARFRAGDADTPLILMGYYNPIYRFGAQEFAAAAGKAGVDGLIIVDLPPEEDEELAPFTRAAGIDLIRLVTPTTDAARLPKLIAGAGGFLYYVSITGVTGTRAAAADEVAPALARLRKATDLPIAVGFGIRSPEQAAAIGAVADAVVVGSSIADAIANALASGGDAVAAPLDLVRSLSAPLRAGRA